MKKASDYNLTDPKIMEDPYEFYTAIHNDDARAVHVEGVGYWIGRMDDIKEITKNTSVFSNSYFSEGGPLPTGVSGEPLEKDVKEIFDSTDFNKSFPTSRVLSLPLLRSLILD